MIVLITGVPGSGKTAYAVTELLRSDKPVAVLNLRSDKFRQLETLEDVLPLRNMTVLIDEAQAYFGDEKLRYWCETHRHYGITLYLTTQGTIGIPRWMRPLIGEHIHITEASLTERRYLKWPRIANPLSSVDVRAASKEFAPVRREAFDYYSSVEAGSEMPPIRKGRIPWKYGMLAGIMVAVVLAGWYGNRKLSDMTKLPAKQASAAAPVRKEETIALPPALSKNTPTPLPDPLPTPLPKPASQPLPETPVIVGCVQNGESCRCYDVTATVVPTNKKACQARIRPY